VPKKFFRTIERLMREIDASKDAEGILQAIMRRLLAADSDTYGIESARLYREKGQEFVLIESIGEYGEAIAGKSVPRSYPIVQEIEKRRLVLISPDSPGFDPEVEEQFTHLDNAAILLGKNPGYILSLGIKHTGSEDELLVLLETIRASAGLKLRQSELESQLRQARTIQLSLLPRRLRQLEGFELAAATYPAEEVGGDLYDVQRIDGDLLGIAVADASGHGLPAALQARDVVIGLRMGAAKDQKILATVERLNRVIHKSGLSSRFISLFYAEVEETGNVVYVNCGHCPPLLFNPRGKVFELPSSGPVLGPLPTARYRRSYANLRPGEYLVLFTDGVTERKADEETDQADDDAGQLEFGRERLIDICRENLGCSAKELVSAITEAVREFGGGQPFADDVTVMVLRRLPADRFAPKKPLGAVKAQSAPDPVERR